jgi:hypothetical protein
MAWASKRDGCDWNNGRVCALKLRYTEQSVMDWVKVGEKARRRDSARFKARYGPRGSVADRRPAAVRNDRGAVRRLRKAIDRAVMKR